MGLARGDFRRPAAGLRRQRGLLGDHQQVVGQIPVFPGLLGGCQGVQIHSAKTEHAGRGDRQGSQCEKGHQRLAFHPAPKLGERALRPGSNRFVIQEAFQVGGEIAGGLITLIQIASHRLQNDGLQVAGQIGNQPPRGRNQRILDLFQQLGTVGTIQCRPQCDQFIQCQPETVDVAAVVDLARQGLGGHVLQRSDQVVALGDVVRIQVEFGESKVGQPDHFVAVDQQV